MGKTITITVPVKVTIDLMGWADEYDLDLRDANDDARESVPQRVIDAAADHFRPFTGIVSVKGTTFEVTGGLPMSATARATLDHLASDEHKSCEY